MVDCVGKPRIFIQFSCLIAPPHCFESALWRTGMLLPNAGGKIADWLLRGFIQCANIQVLIARSNTASLHKFGGCGYDDKLHLSISYIWPYGEIIPHTKCGGVQWWAGCKVLALNVAYSSPVHLLYSSINIKLIHNSSITDNQFFVTYYLTFSKEKSMNLSVTWS